MSAALHAACAICERPAVAVHPLTLAHLGRWPAELPWRFGRAATSVEESPCRDRAAGLEPIRKLSAEGGQAQYCSAQRLLKSSTLVVEFLRLDSHERKLRTFKRSSPLVGESFRLRVAIRLPPNSSDFVSVPRDILTLSPTSGEDARLVISQAMCRTALGQAPFAPRAPQNEPDPDRFRTGSYCTRHWKRMTPPSPTGSGSVISQRRTSESCSLSCVKNSAGRLLSWLPST